MLQDLNQRALECRCKYRDEFKPTEVVISDEFKKSYKQALQKDNVNIDFTQHTAIVTTTTNLKIYIPNQWFVAAKYMVPFVQLFIEYRELLLEFLNFPNRITSKVLSQKVKELKEETFVPSEIAKLENDIYDFLIKRRGNISSQVENQTTAKLLTKFATDYTWWFGSKTIDRQDAYVSPVLELLEVVNASQGHIADICYKFATVQSLATPVLNMQSISAERPVSEAVFTAPDINAKRCIGGINKIIYGAPGTGKSRYIEDNYSSDSAMYRVVFHPEYTYFDFVGSYKPVCLYKQNKEKITTVSGKGFEQGEPVINYQFVPGPFIKCLVNAWLNPSQMYTLVIEEINRANTAAVFGEIFQLLDRDINGRSEYPIEISEDLHEYLVSNPHMEEILASEDGLRIPSNMNIIATMNSADQGVQTMDSAFKRRWAFHYLEISLKNAIHKDAQMLYGGMTVTWGALVEAINRKLLGLGFEEDRLVGPYFIRPGEVGSSSAISKLLLYLWDDVLRHNRDNFFDAQINTFSELSKSFEAKDVFSISDFLPKEQDKKEQVILEQPHVSDDS